MELLGRKKELSLIQSAMNGNYYQGIIVYGRRRVGKSSILKQVIENFDGKAIYYQASLDTPESNARAFSSVIKNQFDGLFFGDFSSFEQAMDFLFQQSVNQRLLVVLDEYPFMRQNLFTDSLLQRLIDKYKDSSQLKLILSVSDLDIFWEMIDITAPLFGRFQTKLEVKPFDYYDASLFFPHASNKDKFKYYACFGGIPYYLSLIDPRKTFEENIIEKIVKENAILETEIMTTLYREMLKVDKSFSIMTSVANGARSYKEIKASYDLSVKDSNFNYVVDQLLKIGYLTKTTPIDSRNDNRKTYYEIQDNLLHFYYGLVFPKIAFRSLMTEESFYQKFIMERLRTFYLPWQFEKVSREFLIRLNKRKTEDIFYDIGKYFYNSKEEKKQIEVDLVTLDDNGYTFFECKYTKERIGTSVIHSLQEKARQAKIKPYRLGFVSKNGFEENIDRKNYLFYTLDDFYQG